MTGAFFAAGVDAVDPNHLKDFLTILGWLVGLGGVVWGFTRRGTRVEPDPLRVQKADSFATREFCSQIHTDVERRLTGHDLAIADLRNELKQDRDANEQHASARSAAIYTKIDAVQADMQKGFRDMERSLGRLEAKVMSK